MYKKTNTKPTKPAHAFIDDPLKLLSVPSVENEPKAYEPDISIVTYIQVR